MGEGIVVKVGDLQEELAYFYHNYDGFPGAKLSQEESVAYFKVACDKGRVVACTEATGKLLGYCESWRIGYEQLGRIVANEPFNIKDEDIETGKICYVFNVTVHPDFRQGYVMEYLVSQFFTQNFMCDYFIGQARRKKHQPLKVFKRQEFYDKYIHRYSKGVK